jgi:hypothetical protein
MKFWCKYEYGYINIDDGNFYVTNTGNWSEAEKLAERSAVSKKEDKLKSFWIKIFLYPSLIAFCVMFFVGLKKVLSGDLKLFPVMMIVLAPIGGIAIYRYMKPELGLPFRLPLQKINSFTVDVNKLTLEFTDGEGKPDSIHLDKIPGDDILKIREILLGENAKSDLAESSV